MLSLRVNSQRKQSLSFPRHFCEAFLQRILCLPSAQQVLGNRFSTTLGRWARQVWVGLWSPWAPPCAGCWALAGAPVENSCSRKSVYPGICRCWAWKALGSIQSRSNLSLRPIRPAGERPWEVRWMTEWESGRGNPSKQRSPQVDKRAAPPLPFVSPALPRFGSSSWPVPLPNKEPN